MRLTFTFLYLLVSSSCVFSQYIPNQMQAYQFYPVYNPAISGVEGFDDLKLGYRYQWAGFGEGSPKFLHLGFNKRIKQPLDLAYNSIRLSDFSKAQNERVPRFRRMIHAIGANIFQSSIGVMKSVGGSFNYSVHYPLTNSLRLAAGAGALIENRKLDIGSVTVRDPDEFYDYLLRSSTSQTDLNVRAGVFLYSEKFYIGFSYLPIVNIALQSTDLAMEEPFYRGTIQVGYSLQIADDVWIKPSILSLVQMNNKLKVDYTVKAFIQQKVTLGITYRDIENVGILLGFNINERFSAFYSYEMAVGDFRTFEDGSHELVLAARFNNVKRIQQYLW